MNSWNFIRVLYILLLLLLLLLLLSSNKIRRVQTLNNHAMRFITMRCAMHLYSLMRFLLTGAHKTDGEALEG